MRKIAVINQKGGVGKTTTAVNLAVCLAALGNKVLLVDVDPQANASTHLGFEGLDLDHNLYTLLKKESSFAETLVNAEGVDLIPSSPDVDDLQTELVEKLIRGKVIKQALQPAKGYDYVFLDCPPSLSHLTQNALAYASEIFVPVDAKFLGLKGLENIQMTIDILKEDEINEDLKITAIILTMYDKRTLLSDETANTLKNIYGDLLLEPYINNNILLAEAPSAGQSILQYAKNSGGAKQYKQLAKMINGSK